MWMTGKKEVKPGKRRAPRKATPLSEKDIQFCHLVMKGLPDPKTTQLDRIEAAGAAFGYSKAESSNLYHRKPVQAYMAKYRDRIMMQMVREEVRLFVRQGFTREDVLTTLYDIALLPPERTRGSVSGQVGALSTMSTIMGLITSPRNADEFFKGRTNEELEHFALHGCFAPPKLVN
jgi:hypothetical protein